MKGASILALFVACGVFAVVIMGAHAGVTVEIEFDIKSEQEDRGMSTSSILRNFLLDTNLVSLRYLNTYADGTPDKTPSRLAIFEFESVKAWTEFEKAQKGENHVLMDIFWQPWRRVPWVGVPNPAGTPKPVTQRKEGFEGYVYSLKFTVAPGQQAEFDRIVASQLPTTLTKLANTDGFLERRAHKDNVLRSTLNNWVTYEFATFDALVQHLYEGDAQLFELSQGVRPLLSEFAASIYYPPYSKGGDIIDGKGFRHNFEEAKKRSEQAQLSQQQL